MLHKKWRHEKGQESLFDHICLLLNVSDVSTDTSRIYLDNLDESFLNLYLFIFFYLIIFILFRFLQNSRQFFVALQCSFESDMLLNKKIKIKNKSKNSK